MKKIILYAILISLNFLELHAQEKNSFTNKSINFIDLTRNTKKLSTKNIYNPEGIKQKQGYPLRATISVSEILSNSTDDDIYVVGFCKSDFIHTNGSKLEYSVINNITQSNDNINCKLFFFDGVSEIESGTRDSDKIIYKDNFGNEFGFQGLNVKPIFLLSKNINLIHEIKHEFNMNTVDGLANTFVITPLGLHNDLEYFNYIKQMLIKIDFANRRIREKAKNDSLLEVVKSKNHFKIQSGMSFGVVTPQLNNISNVSLIEHTVSTIGYTFGIIKPLMNTSSSSRIDLIGLLGINNLKVNHKFSMDNYQTNLFLDDQNDLFRYNLVGQDLNQKVELSYVSNTIGLRYNQKVNSAFEIFTGANFIFRNKIGKLNIVQEGLINVARIYPEYSDSIKFIDVFEEKEQLQSDFEKISIYNFSQTALNINVGFYHKLIENISWYLDFEYSFFNNSTFETSGVGKIPIFMGSSHQIYNQINLHIGIAYDIH